MHSGMVANPSFSGNGPGIFNVPTEGESYAILWSHLRDPYMVTAWNSLNLRREEAAL